MSFPQLAVLGFLKRWVRWLWLHPKLTVCLLLVLFFTLLNIIAFNHAYRMTHFSADGEKTQNPEALSFLQKVKVLFAGISLPRPANDIDPGKVGLESTTHRFKSVDGTVLEAWYIPQSQSKGLVLMFHGYAASKSTLLSEAEAFHELGYSTFLVDFRGSGSSAGTKPQSASKNRMT